MMSIAFRFTNESSPSPRPKCSKGRFAKVDYVCAVCNYRVDDDTEDEKRGMLSFPKPCATQYAQWLSAVNDHHVISPNSRVCSDHFNPDDFLKPFKRGDHKTCKLKPGAVPSLLLPKKSRTKCLTTKPAGCRRRKRNERTAKGVTSPTKRTRTPLQPPRNASANPLDLQLFPVIFCPLCGLWKDEPCWSHTTTVADQAVLPYAVASLPQALYLGTSTDVSQVKAIFAKIPLPAQTVFGPLVGALVDTTPGSKYALKDQSDQKIRYFDLENDKLANWMKFVRFAENTRERNAAVYFRDEKVYFVTTRSMQLKEELKVGYSSKYASIFAISFATAPTEEEDCGSEEDTNQSLVVKTVPEIDDYPPLEPLLPGCLPTNEDPVVVNNFTGLLDIPFYPEENSLPGWDSTDNPPHDVAGELCSVFDAAFERNDSLLPAQSSNVNTGTCHSEFAPVTPSPVVYSRTNFRFSLVDSESPGVRRSKRRRKIIHYEDYPESPPESPPPVVTLEDSESTGVKISKRRRRKPYPATKSTECDACGKWQNGIWKSKLNNHRHMWRYHRDHCMEHWKYQCPECLIKWPKKGGLRRHITTMHPCPVTVISQNSQAVQEAMEQVRTSGYFTYNCRSCQRHYLNKAIFDLHKLRHRAKDSLEQRPERYCPCCDYIAESFEDLMEHCVTHSQDSSNKLCIFCGQSAKDIRFHMEKYHAEIMEETTKDWKFQCDECDHRFFRENLLQHHRKLHNDTTSGFQCLYCAKIIWGCDFGTHTAEHSINGVFKCPCCVKTFRRYPLMRLHYRDTHDLKSMKMCDICQEVFRNPLKLKVHMNKVHMSDNREEEPARNKKKMEEVREGSREMGADESESASESKDTEEYPKRIQKRKRKKLS